MGEVECLHTFALADNRVHACAQAAGGVAAISASQTGEVQVWDLEKKELALSKAVTFDTLYGASWSPDGKYVAFGASDT